MCRNPKTTKPFVIDFADRQYVFDVYQNYGMMDPIFFLTTCQKAPAATIDNVLAATFVHAASNNRTQIQNGKLQSEDSFAEIDLNDYLLQSKLKALAADPSKSVVVVEKVIYLDGGYYYKYRFVISWGKYNVSDNAFFVSTSDVRASDTLDTTSRPETYKTGEQTVYTYPITTQPGAIGIIELEAKDVNEYSKSRGEYKLEEAVIAI